MAIVPAVTRNLLHVRRIGNTSHAISDAHHSLTCFGKVNVMVDHSGTRNPTQATHLYNRFPYLV